MIPASVAAAFGAVVVMLLGAWVRLRAPLTTRGSARHGFTRADLSEMTARLDAVQADIRRERLHRFVLGAPVDRPRLMSVRTLGRAGRARRRGPVSVMVSLEFDGGVTTTGLARADELVVLLAGSALGPMPYLVSAAQAGRDTCFVFASGSPGVLLVLAVSGLRLA